LVALDLADNPAQGEVTVTGKGSKTRTVPVGAKARDALKAWTQVRAQHAAPLVRHACAAVLPGPARGAGAARPRQHLDHPGVHASRLPGAGEGLRRRASARQEE